MLMACGGGPPAPARVAFDAPTLAAPSLAAAREAPLRGFVVTAPRVRLYASPGGAFHQLQSEEGAKRLAAVAMGAHVFQVLQSDAQWVKVRSFAAREGEQCEFAPFVLEGLSVHFYVRRADLLPVVARAVSWMYPDGTAVGLRPGLALHPHPQSRAGGLLVRTQGWRFPVAYARVANHVGFSFEAAGVELARATSESLANGYVDPAAPEGRRMRDIPAGEYRLGDSWAQPSWLSNVSYVQGKHRAADSSRLRVELALGCSSLALDVPSARVQKIGPWSGEGIGGAFGENAQAGRVRAGAKLWWPDGTVAGEALHDAGFSVETASAVAARRCFTRALYTAPKGQPTPPDSLLPICVDAADVMPPTRAPEAP